MDPSSSLSSGKEVATLGGGCFWCLEAVYDHMHGVLSVESGYMGGQVADPTYEAVCMGRTGHAEVVQLTCDSTMVSYREILEVFFAIHDPTTQNRQGHDVGTQYRSTVFYHSEGQKTVTEAVIAALTKEEVFAQPIVTEVVAAGLFYMAEDDHQDYAARNPTQSYCQYVVNPKLAKFREQFAEKLKRPS